LNLVHADRVEPNVWRNGAGTARTLLVWPNAEALQVHVALADIHKDSPFSNYAGMQRWFQSISTGGVVLVHAARQVALDVNSPPHEFDGADAPRAELMAGPIQDISFMGPSALGSAHMHAIEAGQELVGPDTWRGVFTVGAAVLQRDGLDVATLGAKTLAWDAGGSLGRWQVRSATNEPLRAWSLHWRTR
jgi:uncharacterized protein